MPDVTIKSNGHHRDILHGETLTPAERAELDYIDWDAVERGEGDLPCLVRYRGSIYDLNDGYEIVPPNGPIGDAMAAGGWQAFQSDSFFSGTVVKYVDDYEGVVIGFLYV